MNFSRLLWLFAFVSVAAGAFAQAPNIELNLRYNAGAARYEVYARPTATQANFNWGPSQISIVAPSSLPNTAFTVTSVAAGAWLDNSLIFAPAADPAHDFHGVGSLGALTPTTANTEILVFHFVIPGVPGCTAGLRLFVNGVDPGSNAAGMNGGDFTNTIFAIVPSVPGGYEAYIGNYNNNGTACCPVLNAAPPNVTIVNSTCDTACVISGGSITAPGGTPCPAGSTLQYSTNGGMTWSNTVPVYAQGGPSQTITTRCNCDSDPTFSSPSSTPVSTVPASCAPLTQYTVGGGGTRCTTDGGLVITLSGSQTGVNYQLLLGNTPVGSPIAGNGSPINFPAQTQNGTYFVSASAAVGTCSSIMTGSATITSIACSIAITDPCVCKNNATTLTNGQFDETITITAPGTQTWTITAVNGFYLTSSAAPPAAPSPVAVGTAFTNIGGNQFRYSGVHVDALAYTLVASNGQGTVLNIGNSCQYPNPSFPAELSGTFCLFSDPVNLVGDPGDANIVSQSFTVNGQPATVFDPSAGLGQYTIVYTVNGGTPKAAGANDPGCIQSVSTIVNVVATPAAIACNDLVQISLDEDCVTEILPDMVLEGTYGCFDDYFVELDKTIPLGNGPWGAPIVTAADINKTYAARVTHLVSGNSCWGLITVQDKLAPTVICSTYNVACAETNFDPAYLSGVLGITAAYPTVVENCGTFTQTFTDQWFDLPCPPEPVQNAVTAYIIRTWVVTDASGNSASCTQTINIIGSRVWDVQFPADVTISCSANVNTNPAATGAPFISFEYPLITVDYPIYPESNYCELQSTYSDQILPVCDGTYKILRTWTVYDWCVPTSPFPPTNNPQYYVQLIKIQDETGPAFVCPEDLTVSTDAYNCCATTDLPDVIMSDACSRINHVSARIYVYDPYTGDLIATHDVAGTLTNFPGNNLWNPDTLANFGLTPCLPIGQHIVEYIATDDCGNHSTCSFELEVQDLTPPVTACDEWTQVALGLNGMAFVNASTFDDGSYDNCNDVFFKARRMNENDCQPNTSFYNQVKFCCEDIGDTILVVLRVYDVDPGPDSVGLEDYEGHYNDCMVQALVEDKIKPICTAPANVTVSCEAFDPSLWAYGQASATDNCCIDTITNTVVLSQFDSLCNKGTITRRWTAIDCGGNTSQCTQRIIVTYNQNYYVKFPADRLISTCDGSGNYGAPEFYGEDCELLATSFVDEIFTVVPDACFKIERTWTVINWCTYNPNLPCTFVPNPNPSNTTNAPANLAGVTVSECGNTVLNWNPTVVKINPNDPTATNYCTFWSANANCYQYKQIIKIYDTQDPAVVTPTPAEFCDYSTNDAAFWNASYWWDAAISSHDLCEGDANIELTATDACSGANISFRYLLFLDLNHDGVMETVVNSVNPPGFNNVQFNNYQAPNYIGGESRQFDFRNVPFNQKWGFGLQTDAAVGANRTARVRWFNQLGQNAVPQLPYGNHKIKWFIEDGCGNEYVYEQPFTVKDCKKPTVVCLNGLSVNLMNTNPAMVQLWASDFLQYTEDNCTPSDLIKIGIRRSGTGTGFPVNPDGTPQTSVQFDCNDLGTQLVELWAIDVAGNADFCETYVLIQDNMGVCGTNAAVAGTLTTELQEGVEDATVELNGMSNGLPSYNEVFSNQTGNYVFSSALPIGSDYTVTPTSELDPLNGVNTWDLVLISRHILGLEPLNTPYKLISADANKSGTITTFDIVELRKLILGTYTELPNNSSWRFIDKTQVFADPNNPFAETIRENISVAQIQQSELDDDFIGAKIGDVDNTAVPNNLVSTDDRTNGTLLFDIEDREVRVGEVFNVTFTADQVVRGYQFTLGLEGLTPALSGGEGVRFGVEMDDENFAFFNDAVTTSWDAPAGMSGKAQFTLRFKALKDGQLRNMLKVSSRITKTEAYPLTHSLSPGEGRGEVISPGEGRGEALDIALRFNSKGTSTIAGLGFELYQNIPNPWVNKTTIGFHLPEAARTTITVMDAAGKLLYTQTADFGKGYNQFVLDASQVGQQSSSLFYKVSTETDADVKQMIRHE